MVELRASQINGCSFCVDMHARELRRAGESDERIATVAAWRDTPWFSDAERSALALTEAVTRIADRPDPVSDEIWAEVTKHYDENQLSGLLLDIGTINVWNRINARPTSTDITKTRQRGISNRLPGGPRSRFTRRWLRVRPTCEQ